VEKSISRLNIKFSDEMMDQQLPILSGCNYQCNYMQTPMHEFKQLYFYLNPHANDTLEPFIYINKFQRGNQ